MLLLSAGGEQTCKLQAPSMTVLRESVAAHVVCAQALCVREREQLKLLLFSSVQCESVSLYQRCGAPLPLLLSLPCVLLLLLCLLRLWLLGLLWLRRGACCIWPHGHHDLT